MAAVSGKIVSKKRGKLEGCQKSQTWSNTRETWFHCYQIGKPFRVNSWDVIEYVKVVIHCGEAAGLTCDVEREHVKQFGADLGIQRWHTRCWMLSDTCSDVDEEPSPDLTERFEIDGSTVECASSNHGSVRMIGGVKRTNLASVEVGPLAVWVNDEFGVYEDGDFTLRFGRKGERGRVVLVSSELEKLAELSKGMNAWLNKRLRTDEYWACTKCACGSAKAVPKPLCPCKERLNTMLWRVVCDPSLDHLLDNCRCCYQLVSGERVKSLRKLKESGKFGHFFSK
jgi:hypothetical protein